MSQAIQTGLFPLEVLGAPARCLRTVRAVLAQPTANLGDGSLLPELPRTLVLLMLLQRMPQDVKSPREKLAIAHA